MFKSKLMFNPFDRRGNTKIMNDPTIDTASLEKVQIEFPEPELDEPAKFDPKIKPTNEYNTLLYNKTPENDDENDENNKLVYMDMKNMKVKPESNDEFRPDKKFNKSAYFLDDEVELKTTTKPKSSSNKQKVIPVNTPANTPANTGGKRRTRKVRKNKKTRKQRRRKQHKSRRH